MASKRTRRRATTETPDPPPVRSSTPTSPIQRELHMLGFGERAEDEKALPSEEAIGSKSGIFRFPTLPRAIALPSQAWPFVLPLLQACFSSLLYFALEPLNLQTGVEGSVDPENRIWPWDIMRLVVPGWMALGNGLDASTAFAFMWVLKTPFYALQYFFYALNIRSFLINLLVDSSSLYLALSCLGQRSINFGIAIPATQRPLFQNQDRALHNLVNSTLIVLLSTSLFAVVIKAVLSHKITQFYIADFYEVQSVELAHDVSMFQIGLIFLPLAFFLRNLIQADTTVFPRVSKGLESLEWFGLRTRLAFGRLELISVAVLFETVLRLATTVQGVTWRGGFWWAGIWNVIIGIQAVLLAWVGNAVEV